MTKRTYENDDYAAMIERMMRAYGKRVADGDEVDLARMLEVSASFDAALRVAVAGQRKRFSWAAIARGLGVTRSAAYQRFGDL